MTRRSPYVIELSWMIGRRWRNGSALLPHRSPRWFERRSCCWRRRVGPTRRSPSGWMWMWTWSASGVSGSIERVWPGWKTVSGPGTAAVVSRGGGRRGQGDGVRAAGGPGGAAVPVELGRAGRARRSLRGWWCRCRPRRCGAGWPRTRSSRGSTGRGSSRGIRTSRSRPPGCWTCTSGLGRGRARRRRVRDHRR